MRITWLCVVLRSENQNVKCPVLFFKEQLSRQYSSGLFFLYHINNCLYSLHFFQDCHVLTFSSTGSVSDHLVLHPQLATGNFIIKAVWLPGSQTELAIITADFVKVFSRKIATFEKVSFSVYYCWGFLCIWCKIHTFVKHFIVFLFW